MSIETASLYPSMVAAVFGVLIAAWHLVMLRFGLRKIDVRKNPATYITVVSIIRMLSVIFLLVVVAQAFDAIPLVFLAAGFVLSRIILVPLVLWNI